MRALFALILIALNHAGAAARVEAQADPVAESLRTIDEETLRAHENYLASLTVARAYGRGKVRPKRSILFAWWNAEEAGLKGSAWWAGHPTRPIEKVTYCLNLDMVGRNPERPLDVEGVKNSEGDALERIITDACEAEKLKITKYDHTNEAMFRSDGVSLLRQGVPATMFFTYWHADYHAVGDHMDKIAYPNLAKISRAAFRIVRDAANLQPGLR